MGGDSQAGLFSSAPPPPPAAPAVSDDPLEALIDERIRLALEKYEQGGLSALGGTPAANSKGAPAPKTYVPTAQPLDKCVTPSLPTSSRRPRPRRPRSGLRRHSLRTFHRLQGAANVWALAWEGPSVVGCCVSVGERSVMRRGAIRQKWDFRVS